MWLSTPAESPEPDTKKRSRGESENTYQERVEKHSSFCGRVENATGAITSINILTVHNSVVGAAVKEDTHGIVSTIVDLVAVDLDVVTVLRGDDTCEERGCRSVMVSPNNMNDNVWPSMQK